YRKSTLGRQCAWRPNKLRLLRLAPANRAQTFIIGLAVSAVKPAEEGNGPAGLNDNPCCVSAAALCLCPSATAPTPLEVLLKTKAQPQFERPVKRLSIPIFYVFKQSNPALFLPSFSFF